MSARLSRTLTILQSERGRSVACLACEHELAPTHLNWKNNARLEEKPMRDFGPPYTVSPALVLRRFSCPACGALLDSETALPEDPFLEDKLLD